MAYDKAGNTARAWCVAEGVRRELVAQGRTEHAGGGEGGGGCSGENINRPGNVPCDGILISCESMLNINPVYAIWSLPFIDSCVIFTMLGPSP